MTTDGRGGWWRSAAAIATGSLVFVTAIGAATVGIAVAQQPTGPSEPNKPGGPNGQTAPSDSPSFDQAARRAALLVATEASILDSLGAFGPDLPPALGDALDRVELPGGDATARLKRLDEVDREGQQVKDLLLQSTAPPSPETAAVLSVLSAPDREAAALGEPVSLTAQTYLDALDDLVYRKGRPLRSGSHPDDGGVLGAALVVIIAQANTPTTATASTAPAVSAPSPSPTSTAAPVPPGGSGPVGPFAVIILVGLLGLVVFAVTTIVRRRAPPEPEATAPTTDDLTGLLEVSRRLAVATSVGAVERLAVREALDLVPAVAGAIVRRGADQLVVGFETEELLIPGQFETSMIRQAADTGQAVLQVSSTERAIRSLPAAVIAVPVVAAGTVEAVVVLVREPSLPFGERERDLLVALAPIIATSLHSARRSDALAEASLIDGLTGVGNRRRLDVELPEILSRFASAPSALMMIDLDHFKAVNDEHGHPAGDVLLRKVAALLENQIRPGDRVYRYGGEEFCVILPDTARDEAEHVAQRVAASVRDRTFSLGVDVPVRITISVGLAVTAGTDAPELIHRADVALYEAKQAGRDRVVTALGT